MGMKLKNFELLDQQSGECDSVDNSCLIDLGFNFIELSFALLEMFGWTSEEILNRHCLEFIHFEDQEKTTDELKKITRARFKIVQFASRIQHKSGNYIPTLWSGTYDPSRQLLFIVIKNLSEFSDTEQQERDLARLINKLPALIGYWDKNLINVYCNNAYSEYFGKNPSEIKGIHIKDLLGPELFKKNEHHINAALNGNLQSFEREITTRNGITKTLYASYIPDIIDGKNSGFFIIASDITEFKILEKQQKDLEAKLATASKMSTLGEIAGGLAHEINNPLAIIIGKTEQLKDQINSPHPNKTKLKEISEKIEMTVARIAKIVKGLNTFAGRTEDEKFTLHNIPNIINETCAFFTEYFRSQNIQLKFICNSSDIAIECRALQLKEVLLNLLNNAHDAVVNSNKPTIQIEVRDLGEEIEISIADSGPGIPPEVKEQMFRPFFTTKEIGKGTGLGLAAAKGIIEAHKGSICIDQESKKTRFIIHLPKKQSRNN